MAINFNAHIREYLDTVKLDIQSELQNQDMNATGTASSSLRVVSNQFLIGEVRGVVYLNFLLKGFTQKPKSVGRAFVDGIIRWMEVRGIMPQRDGEILPATATNIKRSAFSIAKGITEKGTRVTRGEAGIPIRQILDDNLPDYLEGVAGQLLVNFSDKIKK